MTEKTPLVVLRKLRTFASGLSARLLFITIGFLMLVELGLLIPPMTRFRVDYLNDKLATAHLIATALDVYPAQLDPMLRNNLLSQGRMLGMTVKRPNMPTRELESGISSSDLYVYDVHMENVGNLTIDTLRTMFRSGIPAIVVIGKSPANPTVQVEAVIAEWPLREDMWAHARRFLLISLFISIMTAIPLYASLQWLAVRPLKRITASMTGFQSDPEDPRNIIAPSTRSDEVGVAEQTLATMQHELRSALLQKERLAGVGTAVTKISHDLKNILATAMLESERLEQSPDPEVRRLTAGMVRSVHRAVQLSASTLRFAKDGLPEVNKQPLQVAAVLADIRQSIAPDIKCDIEIRCDEDFSFSGDSELLRRAFDNLLRNACEAGATTAVMRAAEEDGYQTIRIDDNGRGLMPKARDNLFVPFAGSTRAGGFGLGLPIARELLRVQGGDITLLSTSAQGTCFVVRLPL